MPATEMRSSFPPTRLLTLLLSAFLPDDKDGQSQLAPFPEPVNKEVVFPGSYIVGFKHGTPISVSEDILKTIEAKADHVYNGGSYARGFAGNLTEKEVGALRSNKHVKAIEENAEVHLQGLITQEEVNWNLARISHNTTSVHVLDKLNYLYDSSAGKGTCSYVIDTGINDTHPDFGGRAKQLTSFVKGEEEDNNGHGTHVAGIIGSTTYGVAKKTKLYGVKIASSEKTTAAILLHGLWYVLDDIDRRSCPKGVIVNVSVAGRKSKAVEDAALELVERGALVVAAAGNHGIDACHITPASSPQVCTVGAIDVNNQLYQTLENVSNYGPCVKVFAPGINIPSLRHESHGYMLMSGTSQAAAHVAGMGAYLAALEGIEGIRGTKDLCHRIRELAIKDAIVNIPKDTENLIAFNGIDQRLAEPVIGVDQVSMPFEWLGEVSSLQPSETAGSCRFFGSFRCEGHDSFPAFHNMGRIHLDGENIKDGMDIFQGSIRSFRCDGEPRPFTPHTLHHWAWSVETQRAICSHFDKVHFDFRMSSTRSEQTSDTLSIVFQGAEGVPQVINSDYTYSTDSHRWIRLNLKTMFKTEKVEIGRLRKMLLLGNITKPDGGNPWKMDGIIFGARCAESGLQVTNNKFSRARISFLVSPEEKKQLNYVRSAIWTGPDDWTPQVPCSHLSSLKMQLKMSNVQDAGSSKPLSVIIAKSLMHMSSRPGDDFTGTVNISEAFGSDIVSFANITSIRFSTETNSPVKPSAMVLYGECSGADRQASLGLP
ncbi:subtilisin-like serine protease precursor [Ophiocordyceps camponoti-floridani]|uniref:Subtilisin-like serine protease n=1 Tax=Ophiocordyceps camponoti-floridani TaxID=2030778 RepID=A0A8H4VH96_9HYPO|nr:subtilisin-like serine protease precursor [Ophiocordyceps camponoti-floridani]